AQSSLQQAREVLKPSMSCSAPNTTTFAASRPAVVLGTFAHAWLNGAAADSAPFAEVVRCVVAVAVAATKSTAAAAPAMSITLLCIDSLRIELRRVLCTSAAPARSYARAEGVPFRL